MFDCNNLLHPFQNDPGTSQRQRIIDQLLSDSVKIDARSLSDLLNFFSKLSTGINFYDKELNISNWQPFFSKSLPFLLASLSRYDDGITRNKFELYKKLFNKQTSIQGLQLMISFILYNTFSKINSWYEIVKGSNLPIEDTIEELIRTKLAAHLKTFIAFANTASKWFCTKKIDFTRFLDTADTDVWNLEIHDLYSIDIQFSGKAVSRCELLELLYKDVSELLPTLLEGMKQVVTSAEDSIKDSLVPQAKELQENHAPHLALVFAFISLFQKLQGELNKKTKDHLHFFYAQVLKIKPAQARADTAHVVFELQKLLQDQYEKFKIDTDTVLLAGRDDKNSDILFNTDEEIIVNETQVTDLRTLFLHYEHVIDKDFLEGVYIASNATKADGVGKDFKDEEPKNWYTLGRDKSKFIEPGKKTPKLHPQARIGFVFASQVLYLTGGERTININIGCRLTDPICKDNDAYAANLLYTNKVRNFLSDTITNKPKSYLIINNDLLEDALTQGITTPSIDAIRNRFLDLNDPNTCTLQPQYREKAQVEYKEWIDFLNEMQNSRLKFEVSKLPELFKERFPIRVYFSGEEEWIVPTFEFLELTPLAGLDFMFKMQLKIDAGRPAVTFFNKANLKEDLGTTLPLVKIEMDDSLKIEYDLSQVPDPQCCLEREVNKPAHFVSLYHFYRNITVMNNTEIKVKVCELKNFVVQNDENVMDVNAPVYPFGTRPDVPSFDMVNPVAPPPGAVITGPNFYIGSKEVFNKKWTKVQLNINWKDKPLDFREHYKGYLRRIIPPPIGNVVFGLREEDFEYQLSFLQDGTWKDKMGNDLLFPAKPPANQLVCTHNHAYTYHILIDFQPALLDSQEFLVDKQPFQRLDVGSRDGFIKLSLRKQDFGHKNYPFVLARQMLAFGKLPKDHVEGAVYYDQLGQPIVISTTDMLNALSSAGPLATRVNADILVIDALAGGNAHDITLAQSNAIRTILRFAPPGLQNLKQAADFLRDIINNQVISVLNLLKDFQAIIPNEPWTPVISNLSLDYTATASIADIDLIHLYPFANTYKSEEIELKPTLFPTFCDEGTLFVGLSGLQPGSNLHVLFQLAEATADSEAGKEDVKWQYLDSNNWRDLRVGFEVLNDESFDLTTSGIVKFALPGNMSTQHTTMPANIHWIKASLEKNSRTASETIGIHTQVVSATFSMNETTDTARLGAPLDPGKIEKLLVATPNIKSLTQPYESIGGRLPELEGSYYVRVSEQLRHKGRAIQKWDYERMALEEFPLIYKAKCINHSFHADANKYFNDVPYAPGYVILAVIPDLRKLKAGNSFEPKVPVSILNKIDSYIKKRTSPFVRLKASNPRYEKIHFCITVRFKLGVDENFYTEKLKSDLSEYLAPWAVGKFDKLTFGQCVYRSDVIRFIERSGYVDFIIELKMKHDNDTGPLSDRQRVCPASPRSILIAGNIDVVIDAQRCDTWCEFEPEQIECDQYQLVNDYCIPEGIPVIPVPEPTPPQPPIT